MYHKRSSVLIFPLLCVHRGWKPIYVGLKPLCNIGTVKPFSTNSISSKQFPHLRVANE